MTGGVMALKPWDERLDIGHTKIDEQHRGLADTLGDLEAAMVAGKGREELHRILVFLRDSTASHFRTEEELMAQARYEGAFQHREIHQDLEHQVETLVAAHQQGDLDVTPAMLAFLQDWLTRHIQTEDVQLVKFLRQQKPQRRSK